MIALPLVFLLGAFGRRTAGGALNQWFPTFPIIFLGGDASRVMGDTPARLIYGALIALAAFMGGCPSYLVPVIVLGVWFGTTTGNFESLAMGRQSRSFLRDFMGMSAHGFLSLIPVVFLLMDRWFTHNDYFLSVMAFGYIMAAPCYVLGYAVAEYFKTQPKMGLMVGERSFFPGLNGGTEMAEAFWGGLVAVTTYLTFAMAG